MGKSFRQLQAFSALIDIYTFFKPCPWKDWPSPTCNSTVVCVHLPNLETRVGKTIIPYSDFFCFHPLLTFCFLLLGEEGLFIPLSSCRHSALGQGAPGLNPLFPFAAPFPSAVTSTAFHKGPPGFPSPNGTSCWLPSLSFWVPGVLIITFSLFLLELIATRNYTLVSVATRVMSLACTVFQAPWGQNCLSPSQGIHLQQLPQHLIHGRSQGLVAWMNRWSTVADFRKAVWWSVFVTVMGLIINLLCDFEPVA